MRVGFFLARGVFCGKSLMRGRLSACVLLGIFHRFRGDGSRGRIFGSRVLGFLLL